MSFEFVRTASLRLTAVALLAVGCASNSPAPSVRSASDGPADDQPTQSGQQLSALAVPARAPLSEGEQGSIADVAERALPAVVNIASKRVVKERMGAFGHPFFEHFFGPGAPQERDRLQRGMGSGVIVSTDGIVVTNNHVVEEADEIKVTVDDKREFDAEVVGTDKKSDLAVLRLKGDVSGLVAMPFGDSGSLRLGEVVLAVGNPFGVGQTVTMGIVSAKGRANVGIVDYEDFIQTDAAINPGNSGGALINLRGELVGINTAILSRSGGYQGIGFAIPTAMARPIVESLMADGTVHRGWLGVGIQMIDADLAEALKLPSVSGVLVSEVGDGTPAEAAGMKQGDVVTSINGVAVTSPGQFRNAVAASGAGAEVTFEVLRQGRRHSVKAKLGELPVDGEKAPEEKHKQQMAGLELERLDAQTRAAFKVPSSIKSGAVVVRVQPGGAASEAGLQRGDVILRVGDKAISDPTDFKAAFKNQKSGLLLVNRQGRALYLVLKP